MISDTLIAYLKQQYKMPLNGIHGIAHWSRVCQIGMMLAPLTGVNQKVVEIFAFIHDSCRLTDKADRHHGTRAARLAAKLNRDFLHRYRRHPAVTGVNNDTQTGPVSVP